MFIKNFVLIHIVLFLLIFSADSFAETRIALVIGNSDYQEQSLKNPINDARDISKTLNDLGFEVELKLNSNQEEMEIAVQNFGRKLQTNTIGLFYYSGHGVQYEGSNYLIPVGAMSHVFAPEHLRYKTVDVGYVLGVMKQSGNGLNIVILDACRNNPFKSFLRSMNKGLKRMSGAEGTIIAYSTSPGKVALDGGSRNSPYTKQLIKFMKTPNLPVELMFKEVRRAVKTETGGKQSPWYEASIDGDFFFLKKIHHPIMQNNIISDHAVLQQPPLSTIQVNIKNLSPGMKIFVKKDAKIYMKDWASEMDLMAGEVLEIKEVTDGGKVRIWQQDKSNWWNFDPEALEYVNP